MLDPVPSGTSIVILGAWNPRIFSPIWVSTELTKAKHIDLAVATSNPSLPLRLQFDGVYLHVGSEKLQISPAEPNDAALERMESLALTVLDRLPHTPIGAVGVNFRFSTKSPSPQLLSVFDLQDNVALAKQQAEVKQTTIKRSLSHSGLDVNLTLEHLGAGTVNALLNFHRTSPTAALAREHLSYGVLNYRKVSTTLLEHVYEDEATHANA